MKPKEHFSKGFLWDPGPGIGHRDGPVGRIQGDAATRRRIFDGVVSKVPNGLEQQIAIALDAGCLVATEREGKILFFGNGFI